MGILLVVVLYLAFVVFMIASMWKIHTKAGQPGWAIFVPIYNLYVLSLIAKKPWWWWLVPIAGPIIITLGIAEQFGKSTGFGIGMLFLGFVFYPMLAFGDAQYIGEDPELSDHLVG